MSENSDLTGTVKAIRPVLPAKNFETSRRFYGDLGFQAEMLTDNLAQMRLGTVSFLLQDYYDDRWADNGAMHLMVTDVLQWWDRIVAIDLAGRYGVKVKAPRIEDWVESWASSTHPA